MSVAKQDQPLSPTVVKTARSGSPQGQPGPHLHEQDHEAHDHGVEWPDGVRIALVALAAALVWFHVWEPFAHVSVIGIAGTLIGIYPILKEAWENIMERRMTMELSMTIAILAALAIGQFFTALIIVLFVLAAEVLEGLTVRRGRTAIKDLLDLLPSKVTVRRNGRTEQLSTDTIHPGEVIEVHPGGRVPVDGEVIGGNSFVDQSTITGRIPSRRETARHVGLCRNGQPVWRSGNSSNADRPGYSLWSYLECGRRSGAVARPHSENCR